MHQIPFLTPKELQQRFPLSEEQEKFITSSRTIVHNILTFKDPRLLLIIGPCSIHDLKGAREYALKLKQLSDSLGKHFYIIMRVYVEKPRTALGWKGFVHDPYLDGSNQIDHGYALCREFLLYLATLKLPAACEFLDTTSAIFNYDLISWGCIGARTATSQVHRQMASDLPIPIAFKNSTDGNIENAVNGSLTASYPHTYLGLNSDGYLSIQRSKGNRDAHIVLRGGEHAPNFDQESIQTALHLLRRLNLPERLLIDCSHDNCKKKHPIQKDVFHEVLNHSIDTPALRGLMIESYLESGNQPLQEPLHHLQYGVSITDPCLGWNETEELLLEGFNFLNKYEDSFIFRQER